MYNYSIGEDSETTDESSSAPAALRSDRSKAGQNSEAFIAFSYRNKSFEQRLDTLSINKLRFSALGFYGRKREKQILEDALRRLKDKNDIRPEIILIGGASGTGKSKLAEQLKSKKRSEIGYIYTSAKFEQQQSDEPYSAVALICRDLCCQILANIHDEGSDANKAALQHNCKMIQQIMPEELGVEALALLPIIPRLSELLGYGITAKDKQSCSRLNFLDAKHQFNLALRRFIRAISSVLPTCIVLDDMHRADQESLDALAVLLTDRDNQGLLIVATYRSNAVHSRHKMMKMVTGARNDNEGVVVTNINIDNLCEPDVNNMIIDLISSDDNEETRELSKLVYRKTAGNAFFVEVFLSALLQNQLLQYNLGLLRFTWVIGEIEQRTRVSENVVDYLTQKMESLPREVQTGLVLAACLGSPFDRQVLAAVAHTLVTDDPLIQLVTVTPKITVDDWLDICKREGLIEPCGTTGFRWVHDKVQESALRLMTPNLLGDVKLMVAEVLVDSVNDHMLEDNIFVAVNHINENSEEFSVQHRGQLKIIELNLRAGKKAIASSGYDVAAQYLRNGISFLRDDCWEKQYRLTLELYTLAAQAERCSGDFDNMKNHCDAVLSRACTLQDKSAMYPILIDMTGNNIGAQEAIDLSVVILSQLDCYFPKRRLLHTVAGMLQMKLKSLNPSEICDLEPMTDERKIEAMRILDILCKWAIVVKSDILPLAIFRSLDWTLRYGLHETAPNMMTAVGLMLVANSGDLQGGREYALEALRMSNKLHKNSKCNRAKTLAFSHLLVLHRTQSIALSMPPILDAYKLSLECGDLPTAMWCMHGYLELSICNGRKLEVIDAGFREHTWKMKEAKQMQPYNCSRVAWQGVINLIVERDDPLSLNGEAMDENTFANDRELVAIMNYQRLQLACIFGKQAEAAGIAMTTKDEFPDHFPGATRYRFLAALSCASMARKTKQRKYLKEMKRLSRIIKGWVKQKDPNMIHCDLIVDAELAVLKGMHQVARKHFEAGIRVAARSGFVHDHALANERYAIFLYDCIHDETEAEYRLIEAIRSYEEWGAMAKAVLLHFQCNRMFLPKRQGRCVSTARSMSDFSIFSTQSALSSMFQRRKSTNLDL